MNYTEFMEEWKPFPKDKVTKQIDKRKKTGDSYDAMDAQAMKAVKNYKTRATDFHKADQKMVGSDRKDHADVTAKHVSSARKEHAKMDKSDAKAAKASAEGKKKKAKKHRAKAEEKRDEANKHYGRAKAMNAVRHAQGQATPSEDKKQADINKKSKEDRRKAKAGMDRANLEAAYKASPSLKKETMNFTEFLSSAVTPLYEKEGDIPKCPPGYRFDKEMKMCVPKSNKDAVSNSQKYGDKDSKPGSGPGYNVWGSSGYDGAGYAWEEKPTSNDLA